MTKQKLSRLERMMGELNRGVRCPQCRSIDGDGQTGMWRFFYGKPSPEELQDQPCPLCGTVPPTVIFTFPGLSKESMARSDDQEAEA